MSSLLTIPPACPFGPAYVRSASVGARRAARSAGYRDKTLHELVVKSLQGLGVMAVLSVGFGWAISGRVLAPLHRVTATARKLSEENLHERIALDGPDDELKELAGTFDAMLARLESAFDSQKRFVANASHELRTPLSIIRTEVDVALANPDATPEELRRMGDVVRRATERAQALIDGLLVLARSDRGPATLAPVDLAVLAEEAVAQAAAEAAAGSKSSPARRPRPPRSAWLCPTAARSSIPLTSTACSSRSGVLGPTGSPGAARAWGCQSCDP